MNSEQFLLETQKKIAEATTGGQESPATLQKENSKGVGRMQHFQLP